MADESYRSNAAALEAEDFDKADQAFYRELLHGVTEEVPL